MLTIDNNSTTDQLEGDELRHTVYLALGANLGDRRANLNEALERMRAGGRLHLTCLSSLYETEPVGYTEQPRFLNMAAEARTSFSPLELLDYVKQIEAELGRQPNFKNGPRPIDVDLLFYDDLVLDEERLQLPHPRMQGRGFVFAPLAEIAPGLMHPVLQRSTAELLDEIDLAAAGVVRYTAELALELTAPRFLLVTGKLAGAWLDEYLSELGKRLGFEYQIAELPIDVAAFMTVRFIADKLVLSEEEREKLDLMIIPGWARGEVGPIEQTTQVKVVRGPTEIAELEAFLGKLVEQEREEETPFRSAYFTETQLRAMHSRITDPNIRIFTDGKQIFAFNNQIFACGGTDEREIRNIFRQLKIENANHAFYLGRELYKAALSIKLGKPYHQDRDLF